MNKVKISIKFCSFKFVKFSLFGDVFLKFFQSNFGLRESVLSKLVCDWEGLGGRGGEEVHDDSIKKIKKKN